MWKTVVKLVEVLLGILIVVWLMAFAAINLSARVINNSDIGQTGICARAMWEAKSLCPPTFIPWSESGIFSLAVIGAPIYGMTGSIWLAQTIPPIIMSGLIVIAVMYFLRGLEMSKLKRRIFLLLLLCFPISFYPQSMVFLFYAAYSQCVLSFLDCGRLYQIDRRKTQACKYTYTDSDGNGSVAGN